MVRNHRHRDEILRICACSVHGGNGTPDCQECWDNLQKLFMLMDKKVEVIGP